MKASTGFTIVELLIAIVIISVGVIAAVSLQTTALRASAKARNIQEVTNAVRTEAELQRQAYRQRPAAIPASPVPQCMSTSLPSGHTCTVRILPCRLSGTAKTLSCANVASTLPVVGDQITVRVVGPQAESVEVRTIVARPPMVDVASQ